MPDFVTRVILDPAPAAAGERAAVASLGRVRDSARGARDSVDALARQFERMARDLDPVIAKESALYEVTELATRAQLAGVIADTEATRIIGLKRAALEAETVTYGKVIAELVAETATMRMADREREISTRLIATETRLKQAGVAVSIEQRAALQAEIATQYELSAAKQKAASGGGGGLGGAVAGIAATLGVVEVVHLSDAYTGLQNRIRLVTSSSEELARVSGALFQVAQDTRFSWESSAETYQRLTNATKDLGLTETHRLALTKELNQIAVESGVSNREAENGLRQLAQGLSAGVLRGQDLRAALEDIPALGGAIAEGLGVSVGKLRELGEKGELTADQVVNALDRVRGSIDQKFLATSETVSQSLVRLKNSAEKFTGELLTQSGLASGLSGILSFLADHMDELGKAIEFVAIALGVKFALGAVRAAIEGIIALNAAIATNPIGVLILAISAGVAAIIVFRDEIVGFVQDVIGSPWAEAGASVLLLLNPLTMGIGILGLVDSGLKMLGSSLGGLVDFLGLGGDAFDDFYEAMRQAEAQEKAEQLTVRQAIAYQKLRGEIWETNKLTVLQWGLMINLGDQIHRTTQIAEAFVGVDIARRTSEIVAIAALVGQIKREIDEIQEATARKIGTIAKDQARDIVNMVQRLQREAREAAAASAALDRELAALEGRTSAAAEAAEKLAKAENVLGRALRANKITMEEADVIRTATIANIAAEEAGKSKLIDRSESINALLEREVELETIRNDLQRERLAADVRKGADAGAGIVADLERGKASLGEMNAELAKGIDRNSPIEGMRRAFSDLAESGSHAGDQIRSAFGSVLGTVRDDIVDLVVTGKASFGDLIDTIFRQLTQLLLDQAFARLIGILGLGSAGGAAAAIPAAIPGHAVGTQYTVAGTGGTDSALQIFRATPGERVTVETPAQQMEAALARGSGGGGGAAPMVRLTAINVMDPRIVPQILATSEGGASVVNAMASRPEMARAALRARRG